MSDTRRRIAENWEFKRPRPRLGEKHISEKIIRNGMNSYVPGVGCQKSGNISLYLGQIILSHQRIIRTTESESRESQNLPDAPDEEYGEVL